VRRVFNLFHTSKFDWENGTNRDGVSTKIIPGSVILPFGVESIDWDIIRCYRFRIEENYDEPFEGSCAKGNVDPETAYYDGSVDSVNHYYGGDTIPDGTRAEEGWLSTDKAEPKLQYNVWRKDRRSRFIKSWLEGYSVYSGSMVTDFSLMKFPTSPKWKLPTEISYSPGRSRL